MGKQYPETLSVLPCNASQYLTCLYVRSNYPTTHNRHICSLPLTCLHLNTSTHLQLKISMSCCSYSISPTAAALGSDVSIVGINLTTLIPYLYIDILYACYLIKTAIASCYELHARCHAPLKYEVSTFICIGFLFYLLSFPKIELVIQLQSSQNCKWLSATFWQLHGKACAQPSTFIQSVSASFNPRCDQCMFTLNICDCGSDAVVVQ